MVDMTGQHQDGGCELNKGQAMSTTNNPQAVEWPTGTTLVNHMRV